AAQAVAASAEKAKAGHVGRLVAAFEQPLEAEADTEQRTAVADAIQDRVDPRAVERARRGEMADAGHDDPARACEFTGCLGRIKGCAHGGQRFSDGGEIPRLVVDQRDHRSPFVLGSAFAIRLSFAQATRSARPNALKTASILW